MKLSSTNIFSILLLYVVNVIFIQSIAFSMDDFEKASQVSRENSQLSSQVLSGRHFWSSLTADSNFLTTDRLGATLTLGYQFEYFGIDARLILGGGQYHTIKGNPGYTDTPSGDPPSNLNWEDQTSEMKRVRSDKDSWNYVLYEPGFSVSGKWLPFNIPEMTESARAGFGWGRFTDNANALEFKAYLFSAEASLSYQLKNTPWSLTGAVSWHTGVLILDNEIQSQNIKRLNVNWTSSSIGVMYWF